MGITDAGFSCRIAVDAGFQAERKNEHLDFRLKLNDLVVEIGTAKTRHHNVADSNADPPGIFLGQIEAIPCACETGN